MTIASRGRSTKIAESIASASADRLLERVRDHGRAGAHALQPLDDDELASCEALADDDARSFLAAGLHAPHDRLPVLDDEDIDAFLIGDERGLRHHDFLLRL